MLGGKQRKAAAELPTVRYHPNAAHLEHGHSGYLGSLTTPEASRLRRLRSRVAGLDTSDAQIPCEPRETMLLRFLRARDFDVPEAEAMLRAALESKAAYGVRALRGLSAADVLGCPESAVNRHFPLAVHGRDRRGRLVNVLRAGLLDINAILKVTTMERYLRYTVWRMERIRGLMGEEHERTGIFSESTVLVFDLAGFSVTRAAQMLRASFLRDFVDILTRLYPESNGKTFCVNVPWMFSMVWKAVKPMLDENTSRKVDLLGSDFRGALHAEIDPAMLPACLGGRRPALARDTPVYYAGDTTGGTGGGNASSAAAAALRDRGESKAEDEVFDGGLPGAA